MIYVNKALTSKYANHSKWNIWNFIEFFKMMSIGLMIVIIFDHLILVLENFEDTYNLKAS